MHSWWRSPFRMAIIHERERVINARGTLTHCQWECKLMQLLWKTVWIFLERHEGREGGKKEEKI